MTAAPLVSIVTPAFNSASYLGATIASVYSQTVADFELLIVDDGSTDDTVALARSMTCGDPRATVLSAAHGGPAAARNAALARARGRFIALLDSDDVWDPRYLSEQLGWLARYPDVAIVTANAVNHGGELDGRPLWPETTGVARLRPRDLIVHENAVSILAVFRREVLDRSGGFDPAFTGNEDYEFWLRAVANGFVVLQNRTPLGLYRRRPHSVSADEVRMLNGIIRILEWAARMPGLERERQTIEAKLVACHEELVRAEMRSLLMAHDAAAAALRLKTLSRLREDWRLAAAAQLAAVCPQLLVWAYAMRRAWRS